MSASWAQLCDAVRARAGDRCEYCKMHQALQGASFHVEHILPRSRGGLTEFENLAWACPSCNLHKSDRLDATDPLTQTTVTLFHPRRDSWIDHFCWTEYRIEGISPIGRATIEALDCNSERHERIRRAEEMFDLFPP